MTRPSDLLDAAFEYAAAGWLVHPCREAGDDAKAPYLRHGHKDATTDLATIAEWWQRWPAALVGLVIPPTHVVLDVDPRNGGTFAALSQALGSLPRTWASLSGRGDGGMHAWYMRPPEPWQPLTGTRLEKSLGVPGVDVKVHGYVIAPPSPHPLTGDPYRWLDPAQPVVALPRRAERRLEQPPPAQPRELPTRLDGNARDRKVDGLCRHVARAVEGNRNAALYWAACRLWPMYPTAGEVARLTSAGLAAGLEQREVDTTLASARRTTGGRAA
ncbi:bifunctional DNA primase/polymerase [Demequina pelophila]|uniref:bifunctional DNA primase/polymerase n=1 Tax=Demequina pelophila TaxID=1638984 RepID=UPI000784E8E7|nr:bifunctional DNA primase/polymerase [Demequina pelophila]